MPTPKARAASKTVAAFATLATLATLTACAATPRAPEAPTTLVVGRSPAGASMAEAPSPDEPRFTCPVMPMTLAIRPTPDPANDLVLVTLDAQGGVTPMAGFGNHGGSMGHLDGNGCLVDGEGVTLADASVPPNIWTTQSTHEVEPSHGGLKLGTTGRAMRINNEGFAELISAEGNPEPFVGNSQIVFTGYGPGAECGARMLMIVFFIMMPTLVNPDGNPQKVAPPPGSRCVHK